MKKVAASLRAEDVYRILTLIPEGQVTTYGDIARTLGHPKSSRAIGRILNRNPNPIVVPCHRVVMSDGRIGGYADGQERKIELLAKEGLAFKSGRVKDFEKRRAVLKRK